MRSFDPSCLVSVGAPLDGMVYAYVLVGRCGFQAVSGRFVESDDAIATTTASTIQLYLYPQKCRRHPIMAD